MTSIRDKIRKSIESASTKETAAKKHKSAAKMVAKISAIIQSMGMDEGQWDAVSKQVFKKAFGKKEKASKETAADKSMFDLARKRIEQMNAAAAAKLLDAAVEWFEWENETALAAAKKAGPKQIAKYILGNADPLYSDGGLIDFLIENKVLTKADETK